MAVIYFLGEDEKYYGDKGLDTICHKYKLPSKPLLCFDEATVEKTILDSLANSKDTYILSPLYFFNIIDKYKAFLRVERLENEKGILTSQDIKLGITAEEKLKIKLNSSITKPKVDFSNYGGAKELVDETETINNYFKLGIPVKGIFLAGIPGTGKSFFAKCLAGQLNRYLIELNLTKFMKSDNSVILIEEFFDFFKSNPGDYIIWLDEIEKMFTGTEESTQLLGTLLTKINDFNASASTLKSTAFIVATANNVYELSHRNPEFFRNGRFDLLISINPPTDRGADEIFDIYTNANLKNNLDIYLKAIYFCTKKNLKIPGFETNNGLIRKIFDYVEKNRSTIEKYILENNIKSIKAFVNHIKTDKEGYFATSTIRDLDKFPFTYDVKYITGQVFVRYRDKCQNQVRFPYVPAEIEFFVTSLYKHYLFIDINISQKDIDGYIEKIKPLQASMKDQITKMTGVTSDFRQI